MTAFGYLMLGIVIGLGVACSVCVTGAVTRQSKEEKARNESWKSIVTMFEDIEAARPKTLVQLLSDVGGDIAEMFRELGLVAR
jgi:hypothetical protein